MLANAGGVDRAPQLVLGGGSVGAARRGRAGDDQTRFATDAALGKDRAQRRRISGSRSSLFWRRGFARASVTKSRAPMPSRVLHSTPSAVAEAARRPKSTPFHTVRH